MTNKRHYYSEAEDAAMEILHPSEAAQPKSLPPMRERVEYELSDDEKFLRPDPAPVYPKIAGERCAVCGVSFAAHMKD